jgi:basic amino acid/polyamine antiporter, APA family
MLSFTVAHTAVVALRVRRPKDELVYRARPNIRFRGIDWPLFAILGGLATGAAWIVVVVQEPTTRYVGFAWLAAGFATYAIYRLRVLRVPLGETIRAPQIVLAGALEIDYRTIVVPVIRSAETEEALVAAARLATERGATIVLVAVVEVPLSLPLSADLPDEEAAADELLAEARAIVEGYGVRVIERLVRARRAGPAIVDEAVLRNAELIVVGSGRRFGLRGPVFGRTVDYILKQSPVRVLVTAGKRAA